MNYLRWIWFKITWLFTRKKRKGRGYYVTHKSKGEYQIHWGPFPTFPIQGRVHHDAWEHVDTPADQAVIELPEGIEDED